MISLHLNFENIWRRIKMAWIDLDIELQPYIRQGNLEHCIDHVSKAMKALPDSPFHQILDLKFTNKPQKVAKYFKKFINREKKRIQLKAVYTETNGFCINPDRWFFDLFAYESYGGHENYDWLSVYKSGDRQKIDRFSFFIRL